MKSKMRSKILDNFGLKLLSLLLAFLLWIVVMNVSDSTITVEIEDIPVTQLNGEVLEDLDKIYEVSKGDSVDILVKGRRSVVEGLDADDFTATADLSTMSITNTVQIAVKPKSAGIEDEISITCVDNVMRLNLEEKISLQYSVKVKTVGTVKDGYAVCSHQTSPNIITVEGPKTTVEKITEVGVDVDISGLDKSIDTEKDIVLYDAYGEPIVSDKLEVSHDKVKVHVDVYPTKEVEVKVNVKGTPKEGFVVSEVLYQPQTVMVAGAPEDLKDMKELEVDDIIISGMAEDLETTISLNDYLPDNVYLANVNEEVVITVNMEELLTKTIKIGEEDVKLLQKTADKEYLLELSDDYEIIVKGLGSDISDITIDKLGPKIYCRDMSAGIHSNVEIVFNEIDGISYEVVGSVQVVITTK